MVVSSARTLRSVTDAMAARGDATAVQAMQKEGVVTWSYAELADQARHVAGGLADLGVDRGHPVAILAENSPEWIAMCMGIIHAGAVPVPVDVQMPAEGMAHVLNDCGACFIATPREGAKQIEQLDIEARPRPIFLETEPGQAADGAGERGGQRGGEASLEQFNQSVPADPEPPSEHDVAVLFYTSGTTGPPKGVPLTHANLMFQLGAMQEAQIVGEGDRVLLPLPLHHVYPFVLGMLTPLSLGLPVVLPRSLTGPQIVRAMREGEVTTVIGVPRLYQALLKGVESQVGSIGRVAASGFRATLGASTALRRRTGLHAGRRLFGPLHRRFAPKLRIVTSGGSPLAPETAWRLEGMGWRVVCGYGLTETSPLLTWNRPKARKFGTAGRPLPDVELRIDPEAAPEGSRTSESGHEMGEILARGPGVVSGYRNRPDKTAEVLTDGGWFRTGDLGYIDDDGYLHVVGRVSTMIVTQSGENVQPDQVEQQYEAQPAIAEAGVLERDGRLVALFVPAQKDDADAAVREAVRAANRELASYQHVGDYLLTRAALPRTRLGKIRRDELEQRYEQAERGEQPEPQQRGPMPPEQMSSQDRSLLSDPAVKQVWDWLVGRYPDTPITPDSDLEADLGIDSMAWLDLTLEISEQAGVELEEEAIAETQTVRDLLEAVAGASAGDQKGPAPLEEPEQTLSDRQRRWLEPLSGPQATLASGVFAVNRVLARRMFEAEAKGLEHLPDEPPFVLAANHASDLDPFVLAAVLPEEVRRQTFWGGWAGRTMTNPLKRWGSRLFQAVPVDPKRGAISSLAFGAAVLERQQNLMWFPEGERSEDGRLREFKIGLGRLLEQHAAPVVPVVISGTYEAMQRGKRLPRAHPVSVTIGEPVHPEQLIEEGEGDTPAERMMHALRQRMLAMGASGRESA